MQNNFFTTAKKSNKINTKGYIEGKNLRPFTALSCNLNEIIVLKNFWKLLRVRLINRDTCIDNISIDLTSF